MAKTVDNFSTIEDFRLKYNELATDVGDISGLQTPRSGNLTDALNSVNEKDFFFQEFIYRVTSNNEVNFSGLDEFANTLKFRKDRIQVFVNGKHLIEDIDYVISNQNSDGTYGQINLQGTYASGQADATQVNDRVVVYSYTGSYLGVAVQSTGSTFWLLSDTNSIYNSNQSGVIINGVSTDVDTEHESGFNIKLNGRTFATDDIVATAGKRIEAPTLTDGTASLSSGSITSAVNGTFSGQVQAEHLVSTDDLAVSDDATIGGALSVAGGFGSSGLSVSDAGNLSADGDLTIGGSSSLNGSVTLGDSASDNITFTGKANSNIRPSANNTYSLGLSTLKWSNVFSNTFTGDLTGNVTGNVTGDIIGNVTGAVTGTVSDISNHDTGNLSEGSNLYYTNARADARIANASIGDLGNVSNTSASIGQILAWSGSQWAPVDNQDSDAVTEGSTNLFYTNERVDDRVNALLTAGTGITLNYDDANNTLQISGVAQYSDSNARQAITITDAGGDGSLVYNSSSGVATYTGPSASETRAHFTGGNGISLSSGDISANVSNGIEINSDNIELDYEVISSGSFSGTPSGAGHQVGHLFFVI
tara:strand:- start:458 stop:2227 length:1770 start_codon:yes stop_codon:yes gene_type:complete